MSCFCLLVGLFYSCVVFAQPVIEFIPDSRAYGNLLTHDVLNKDFSSLTAIQQLQRLFAEAGYEMRQTFLDELPPNRKLVTNAYRKGGSKENVQLVICYNHPFFLSMCKFWSIPNAKRAVVLWEPPCVIPQQYSDSLLNRYALVWTFHDGMLNRTNCRKIYYQVLEPMIQDRIPFAEKKLACQISRNKQSTHPSEIYSLRENIIRFYENRPHEAFDFYGYGWETSPFKKNYQGAIPSKKAVMKNYRFSYCFENSQNIPGYVTEKIFDSFSARCVPIYLGANNIIDYIPANCFIDMRHFPSILDVHKFISAMDEETYNEYLDNIEQFLQSPEAQLFSKENFVQTVYTQAMEYLEQLND